MVDVLWCNDDDIENVQRRVLFLDIITDAAGRFGDCVRKAYAGHFQSKRTYNLDPVDHSLPTKYNKSLRVDSEILFKYKTIK